MSRIFISCGEASGDLYASALAYEIRQLDPGAHIVGFGGERLRAAGAKLIGDYRGMAVTGLTEAFLILARSYRMYKQLVAAARDQHPNVLVAVDFPDFNFRLAAAINRLGVPVVYYVSPQLWAWRSGRLQTMKRLVSKVLVIFPFEEAMYRDAGVPVEFVGHPLVDLARATEPREAFLRRHHLNPSAPIVALLPGSRPNEVRSILPVLLDACRIISARLPDAQFVVARAPHLDASLFASLERVVDARGRHPVCLEDRTDDVLAACDVVVTASGTATVQAAVHERPMVIVYKLSPLTYHLGKPFVRVKTYGMANLVAGTRIVPELIQDGFTPQTVADETMRFLTDTDYAARTRAALRVVRDKLGAPGASRRAAEAVMRVVRGG